MNESNEMPRGDSQKTADEKRAEESESQETQQYDKDLDPNYQKILLDFFRKNANEREPLFDEIQKIIAEGDVDAIHMFRLSYTDQLSEEARDYVSTEYTLMLMEQKENARDNFNPEQQTEENEEVESYESLKIRLKNDPVYKDTVQAFFSRIGEEVSYSVEERMNKKVMLFTSKEHSSAEIQDFTEQNIAYLSSEARNYLEGKKSIAQMLETKRFE